jgi:hypothetical protein
MIVPDPHEILRWSRTAQTLRALLIVAGASALVLAAWGGAVPLVAAVLGGCGLVAAAISPGGQGPGVVLAGAGLAWVLRYGVDAPPVAETAGLVFAMALHHQAAALAAALPVRASVERALLIRFARHGALVLCLTAVVGVLVLGLARPGGSVPLELLGLAAAVVAVLVPVLLSRFGPRQPGAR